MNTVNIKVQFPEDVFVAIQSAGISRDNVEKEVREATAVNLFKKGVLSLGKGSELARMCLADFIDLLVKNDVPVVEYTEEDYKRDLKVAKRVVGEKR